MDLKVRRASIKKFLAELVQHCIKNDVAFNLRNEKNIFVEGLPCSGYFEGGEEKGELVVAVDKPQKQWLPILVHESCHLDQWLEDKEKFISYDGLEVVDQWLNGKRATKKKLTSAIEASKKLELDCEIRSVAKIKKYKLPIDITTYIQMANSYIYFYNWVLENRRWLEKGQTLYLKEIYEVCPTEFQSNYKKTPKAINDAFNEFI